VSGTPRPDRLPALAAFVRAAPRLERIAGLTRADAHALELDGFTWRNGELHRKR
jgi:hypothetical protein